MQTQQTRKDKIVPRRKKIDLNVLGETLMAQIEARIARVLNRELRLVHQRLDKLERSLGANRTRSSREVSEKSCSKPGCKSKVVAHGLCSKHYQQWRYHKKKAEREQQISSESRVDQNMVTTEKASDLGPASASKNRSERNPAPKLRAAKSSKARRAGSKKAAVDVAGSGSPK